MPFLTATPWLLPAITGGVGIWQALSGQQMQREALAEAKKPRFTEEMAKYARESGTSNIQANLAQRGLMDSSMLPGGLANLEKAIGEARAGAGTMGDVPGMLWQNAMGLGQGGSETLGNLYQSYLYNRLFGGQQGASQWQPQWASLYDPSMYTQPYSPVMPKPDYGYLF